VINREFVPKPRFKYDGWFRRTGVSVEAGPSGSGKTTLMLDLLHKQQLGIPYLNHEPGKLDFCVLYADRKKRFVARDFGTYRYALPTR
jgi:RecA-family ATPase